MNLLAYNLGTNIKVVDSAPAHAHPATQADVEAWAAKRDLLLIPKTEWLALTEHSIPIEVGGNLIIPVKMTQNVEQ